MPPSPLAPLTHARRTPPPPISASRITIPPPPTPLGRGTFAVVHLAFLDSLHPIALKCLRPRPMRTSTLPITIKSASDYRNSHTQIAQQQFYTELERLTALRNVPAVVRCYGMVDMTPWGMGEGLVLERLAKSLAQCRVENSPCPRCLVDMCVNVAKAVAELHRRRFSHGDLKPANVMFTDPKEGSAAACCKLIDFGLSRDFNRRPSPRLSTCTSHLSAPEAPTSPGVSPAMALQPRGTPPYLSPEAWCGDKTLCNPDVAYAADVYALGVVLYELDTGLVPWKGLGQWPIFIAVANMEKRPVYSNDVCVPGLRRIVQLCWAQDWKLRPDGERLVSLLKHLQQGIHHCHDTNSPIVFPQQFHHTVSTPTTTTHNIIPSPSSSSSSPQQQQYTQLPSPPHRIPPCSPASSTMSLQRPPDRLQPVAAAAPAAPAAPADTHNSHLLLEPFPEVPSEPSLVLDQVKSAMLSQELIHVDETFVHPATFENKQQKSNTHYKNHPLNNPPAPNTTAITAPAQPPVLLSHHHSSTGFRTGESFSTCTTTTTTRDDPPPAPRNLDYAFKTQVLTDDVETLCRALVHHERDPAMATRAMEAMAVLLDQSPRNCRRVAAKNATRHIAIVLSRYGRHDPRLCKSASVIVLRLATFAGEHVERQLRTSAACEIILNSMKWHPAHLPVIQNGAAALHALCNASGSICCIIAELGGASSALRAIARSCTSFSNDVPVATAGLDVITAMSKQNVDALISARVLAGLIECCDVFCNRRIDEQCVNAMYAIVRNPVGCARAITTPNCLEAISRLIDRTSNQKNPYPILAKAYGVVAELASTVRKSEATNAFISSNIVESVLESMDAICKTADPSSNNVALAGLGCIKNMSSLGRDVCGSLQMSNVFDIAHATINHKPTHRTIALRTAQFLETILNELKSSSYVTNLDLVFQMLVQLQEKWLLDSVILPHVKGALRIVRENSDRSRFTNTNGNTDRHHSVFEQDDESQRSSLMYFVKRISNRKQQSLHVGGA